MKHVQTTESRNTEKIPEIEKGTDIPVTCNSEEESQLKEQLLEKELATLRQELEQVKREKADLEISLETKTKQLQQCTTMPERETLLQLVLDNIPQLIFWKDRNSVFQGCNRHWARASNLDHPHEVIGKTESNFHEDSTTVEYYLERDRRVIDTGEPELYIEYKLEKDVWFDTKKIPIHDPAGNIVGLLGTTEDITQRKKAEEALRKSEARNRALLNAIPDLMLEIRTDGMYLDCLEAKSGKWAVANREDRIGKRIWEVLPATVAQQNMQAIQQALQTGETQTLEYELLVGEEYQTFEARVVACSSNSALSIVRNVTDRKQAEEALRIAEENYRSIFENALEGIFQSTPDGQFISVNPAMASIHGYDSPEEMRARIKEIGNKIYVDPNCRNEFKRLIEEKGKIKNFEYQVYRQDGSLIWVSENAQAVRATSGQLLYYEGIIQDITKRKMEESALKQQVQELQIEIDQQKQACEVAEIIQSKYFQELQADVENLLLDDV